MASKKKIDEIWEKAKTIRGQNSDVWRKDEYGNKIRKASYGTTGEYGWEVDHSNPKNNGGTDHGRNLKPLHWEENRKKADKVNYKKK
jgi:5-methylcytosine-specific restriction endonuclease McrA